MGRSYLHTNNRAVINEKKGADAGIDGRAYFKTGKNKNAKVMFQVKSGGINRGDVAKLRGDMERDETALAVLTTLEKPRPPTTTEAKPPGHYKYEIREGYGTTTPCHDTRYRGAR